MTWKEYQEKVATLFRRLGCSAKVDATIQGARGKHNIDVWVEFNKFGYAIKWCVECKYWKNNVSKDKVLTLQGIVQDVGADRGFIVTEKGFQSGAKNIVKNSNITITRFKELKEKTEDALYKQILQKLEKRTLQYRDEIMDFYVTTIIGPMDRTISPKAGLDYKKEMVVSARLFLLEDGFDRIKIGRYPLPYNYDKAGKKRLWTHDVRIFVKETAKFLDSVEQWIIKQKKAIRQAEKLTKKL